MTTRRKRKRKFNWYEVIERARKRRDFDYRERDLALSWTTCACGRQSRLIPRRLGGEPKDRKLLQLGCHFTHCIITNKFSAAKSTLDAIEQRAAEVVKEARGRK